MSNNRAAIFEKGCHILWAECVFSIPQSVSAQIELRDEDEGACSNSRDNFKKLLTGRRYGDRWFMKWTRFLVKVSWLNVRRKCCKACGTGTQERYWLICACVLYKTVPLLSTRTTSFTALSSYVKPTDFHQKPCSFHKPAVAIATAG